MGRILRVPPLNETSRRSLAAPSKIWRPDRLARQAEHEDRHTQPDYPIRAIASAVAVAEAKSCTGRAYARLQDLMMQRAR
jgi:hypothetical protein